MGVLGSTCATRPWCSADGHQAFEADKTIGNLAWLYNVLSSSKIASPLDRILHYPLPRTPIPGGSELEVTVSNYTTFSRDYARTMIELLGGKYTGTMARTSTHVCSAKYVDRFLAQAVALTLS